MGKTQQTFQIKSNEKIFVRSHANLDIQGWEKPELNIITDLRVQRLERDEDSIRFVFVDDCEMSLPFDANLNIDRASGNARIRNLNNSLKIRRVAGNLALQKTADVEVEGINGNCLVQDIQGSLEVERIVGHLRGEIVHGKLIVDRISGNVDLSSVSGQVKLNCNGKIRLCLSAGNHEEVSLKASGDIVLNLPLDADATIQVRTSGRKAELQIGDRSEVVRDRDHTFILGTGLQRISIDTAGKVKISGEAVDPSEIAKLFKDLDELWVELKKESEARREAKDREMRFEIEMMGKTAQVVEQAMEGAMKTIGDPEFTSKITQEALDKTEKRVQEALRRVEDRLRTMGFDLSQVPTSPRTPSKPPVPPDSPAASIGFQEEKYKVTAEERLIIVQMLQQGKITIEEADQLLRALEDSAMD